MLLYFLLGFAVASIIATIGIVVAIKAGQVRVIIDNLDM